jgi:hypothetical protein
MRATLNALDALNKPQKYIYGNYSLRLAYKFPSIDDKMYFDFNSLPDLDSIKSQVNGQNINLTKYIEPLQSLPNSVTKEVNTKLNETRTCIMHRVYYIYASMLIYIFLTIAIGKDLDKNIDKIRADTLTLTSSSLKDISTILTATGSQFYDGSRLYSDYIQR